MDAFLATEPPLKLGVGQHRCRQRGLAAGANILFLADHLAPAGEVPLAASLRCARRCAAVVAGVLQEEGPLAAMRAELCQSARVLVREASVLFKKISTPGHPPSGCGNVSAPEHCAEALRCVEAIARLGALMPAALPIPDPAPLRLLAGLEGLARQFLASAANRVPNPRAPIALASPEDLQALAGAVRAATKLAHLLEPPEGAAAGGGGDFGAARVSLLHSIGRFLSYFAVKAAVYFDQGGPMPPASLR